MLQMFLYLIFIYDLYTSRYLMYINRMGKYMNVDGYAIVDYALL
jgi:hypothetical protein